MSKIYYFYNFLFFVSNNILKLQVVVYNLNVFEFDESSSQLLSDFHGFFNRRALYFCKILAFNEVHHNPPFLLNASYQVYKVFQLCHFNLLQNLDLSLPPLYCFTLEHLHCHFSVLKASSPNSGTASAAYCFEYLNLLSVF